MKQTKFAKALALCLGVLVFSGAISYLIFAQSAWQPPSKMPPESNVATPINTGPTAQTKAGQLNISRDNWGECCSEGDYTLSLAENTITTGKKAGIQFHNSMEAEGQLRLDVGTNGRELKAYSNQTDMDLHATGYVRGDHGLCIGSDCRTAWPGTIASSCPSGKYVVGIAPNGEVICEGGLTGPTPGGKKRIFVTGTTYTGSYLTNGKKVIAMTASDIERIDAICQGAAESVGITGHGETYKALLYVKNSSAILREPNQVLKSYIYVNAQNNSGTIVWHEINSSASMTDFFTSKSGQYLAKPIQYNEAGAPVNHVEVHTNFAANGTGGYTYPYALDDYGFCDYWAYFSNGDGDNYTIGYADATDASWCGYQVHTQSNTVCESTPRSLYCVEQ